VPLAASSLRKAPSNSLGRPHLHKSRLCIPSASDVTHPLEDYLSFAKNLIPLSWTTGRCSRDRPKEREEISRPGGAASRVPPGPPLKGCRALGGGRSEQPDGRLGLIVANRPRLDQAGPFGRSDGGGPPTSRIGMTVPSSGPTQ